MGLTSPFLWRGWGGMKMPVLGVVGSLSGLVAPLFFASFFLVELKGWVYGTSPELWGKCRECQSKAELRAGKKALDGGCALESALSLLPFFPPLSSFHHFLRNFPQLLGSLEGPQRPLAYPGGRREEERAFFGKKKPLWGLFLSSPCWKEAARVVVFPSLEAMAHLHFCALS